MHGMGCFVLGQIGNVLSVIRVFFFSFLIASEHHCVGFD